MEESFASIPKDTWRQEASRKMDDMGKEIVTMGKEIVGMGKEILGIKNILEERHEQQKQDKKRAISDVEEVKGMLLTNNTEIKNLSVEFAKITAQLPNKVDNKTVMSGLVAILLGIGKFVATIASGCLIAWLTLRNG